MDAFQSRHPLKLKVNKKNTLILKYPTVWIQSYAPHLNAAQFTNCIQMCIFKIPHSPSLVRCASISILKDEELLFLKCNVLLDFVLISMRRIQIDNR